MLVCFICCVWCIWPSVFFGKWIWKINVQLFERTVDGCLSDKYELRYFMNFVRTRVLVKKESIRVNNVDY